MCCYFITNSAAVRNCTVDTDEQESWCVTHRLRTTAVDAVWLQRGGGTVLCAQTHSVVLLFMCAPFIPRSHSFMPVPTHSLTLSRSFIHELIHSFPCSSSLCLWFISRYWAGMALETSSVSSGSSVAGVGCAVWPQEKATAAVEGPYGSRPLSRQCTEDSELSGSSLTYSCSLF